MWTCSRHGRTFLVKSAIFNSTPAEEWFGPRFCVPWNFLKPSFLQFGIVFMVVQALHMTCSSVSRTDTHANTKVMEQILEPNLWSAQNITKTQLTLLKIQISWKSITAACPGWPTWSHTYCNHNQGTFKFFIVTHSFEGNWYQLFSCADIPLLI